MHQDIYRGKIRLIVIAIILFCVALVIYFFLSRPHDTKLTLQKTVFPSSSQSVVSGEYIYSYSGMSFYKTDIHDSSNVTVLNSGLRLPTVDRMFWAGDRGVFLTFGDGGYIGSELEKLLTAENLTFDESTQKYLWYLDFKSSRLTPVSENDIAGYAAYFAEDKEQFYFAENQPINSEPDSPMRPSIRMFSLRSLKTVTISSSFNVTDSISFIAPCSDAICYVTRDNKGDSLYKLLDGGKSSNLFPETLFDSIVTTGDKDFYIGIRKITKNYSGVDDVVLRGSVSYLDTSDKTVTNLGQEVSISSSLFATANQNGSFYIFDLNPLGRETNSYLSGAKNSLGQLKLNRKDFTLPKDSSVVSSVIEPISRSSAGYTMFHDIEENTHLITPTGTIVSISQQDISKVESDLKTCFRDYTKSHLYSAELKQFKVDVTYNSSFAKTINEFAKCVDKTSPQSLVGYSYVFVGVSERDGRYVTD